MLRDPLKPQPVHTAAELALVRVIPSGMSSAHGPDSDWQREQRQARAHRGSAAAVTPPRRAAATALDRTVLDWLTAQGRPVTAQEVRAFLAASPHVVLDRLVRHGRVQVRWVTRDGTVGPRREFLLAGLAWPPLPAGWVLAKPRTPRRW